MRLASPSDFRVLYTDYRRYPFFAQRAIVLRERYPNASICVAGCGKGYLVDELRRHGVLAWGCDASQWAVDEASRVIPGNALFIRRGDCTSGAEMAALCLTVLGPDRKFSVCVTEDLLPVLTDVEVEKALVALRTISDAVFHIITPGSTNNALSLNWKPLDAWKAVVGIDSVMDAESGIIL